jgi:hypothetical protein
MFLQCIKCIILEFTPPPLISFLLPPKLPGTVSTGIIFAFTYMSIHYLPHSYPLTFFPLLLVDSAENPSGPGLYFFGKLFIAASVSLYVMICVGY